jgi:uncharacterized protein YbaR (Trm112 family)
MTTGTILVCPDCGHPRFKWEATVIQTGGIQEFEAEKYSSEQVTTELDGRSDTVTCENCRLQFERSELVAKEDYNDD